MYNDFYSTGIINSSADFTWTIVSVVLALVGGVAAYAIFVSKKTKESIMAF